MVSRLRRLLLGRPTERQGRWFEPLLVALSFVVSLVAYAVDVFTVSGGVILLPGDATVVGCVVAITVGYRQAGLLTAWLGAFAPLLGFRVDWGLFGLSGRGVAETLGFVFDPVSLLLYVAAAIVAGTASYLAGSLLRGDVRYLRTGRA